jgi:hypothetical protein
VYWYPSQVPQSVPAKLKKTLKKQRVPVPYPSQVPAEYRYLLIKKPNTVTHLKILHCHGGQVKEFVSNFVRSTKRRVGALNIGEDAVHLVQDLKQGNVHILVLPCPVINFSIPDPGQKDSRIRIRIKEFKYFNPKNCF